MTRSDIIFFAIILIVLFVSIISWLFHFYQSWFVFWWVLLLPGAIIKNWWPKSKIGVWLNEEIYK